MSQQSLGGTIDWSKYADNYGFFVQEGETLVRLAPHPERYAPMSQVGMARVIGPVGGPILAPDDIRFVAVMHNLYNRPGHFYSRDLSLPVIVRVAHVKAAPQNYYGWNNSPVTFSPPLKHLPPNAFYLLYDTTALRQDKAPSQDNIAFLTPSRRLAPGQYVFVPNAADGKMFGFRVRGTPPPGKSCVVLTGVLWAAEPCSSDEEGNYVVGGASPEGRPIDRLSNNRKDASSSAAIMANDPHVSPTEAHDSGDLSISGIRSAYESNRAPFQPAIRISGRALETITQVTWEWHRSDGASHHSVWRAESRFDGKFVAEDHEHGVLWPVLLATDDEPGTYFWTVSFYGRSKNLQKSFKVVYRAADRMTVGLPGSHLAKAIRAIKDAEQENPASRPAILLRDYQDRENLFQELGLQVDYDRQLLQRKGFVAARNYEPSLNRQCVALVRALSSTLRDVPTGMWGERWHRKVVFNRAGTGVAPGAAIATLIVRYVDGRKIRKYGPAGSEHTAIFLGYSYDSTGSVDGLYAIQQYDLGQVGYSVEGADGGGVLEASLSIIKHNLDRYYVIE